jgi:hypothetical protein
MLAMYLLIWRSENTKMKCKTNFHNDTIFNIYNKFYFVFHAKISPNIFELNKYLSQQQKYLSHAKLFLIESIFDWQECFACLPVGYMDNAMFVLEIVNITYSVLIFPGLKLEKKI